MAHPEEARHHYLCSNPAAVEVLDAPRDRNHVPIPGILGRPRVLLGRDDNRIGEAMDEVLNSGIGLMPAPFIPTRFEGPLQVPPRGATTEAEIQREAHNW
jgi:hypothetical protein